MTNNQSQKIHLLNESGKAYTNNIEEYMRPYLKSLTPEQFEEDKNWWCTVLEITGNQQSSFTIGQIVGNTIDWDQIAPLARIKEWHKQAVDPSAAYMEEAGHVAKYFMMVHPRRTFQYIDNNGGKKGKSARYKMVGAIKETTLDSDINWDNHNHIAWRFGKTKYCGSCSNFKEFFYQIGNFLLKFDTDVLYDFITGRANCKHAEEDFDIALNADINDQHMYQVYDANTNTSYAANPDFVLRATSDGFPMSDVEFFDESSELVVKDTDEDNDFIGVYLYLKRDALNEEIISVIKKLFNLYGLSYDDLKIQFI